MPGALGDAANLGRRPHVEADHHRLGGGGEVDVVLGDPADAGVDDVDPHLGVLDLAELGDDRLDGALHVALDHEVQVLDGAGLHLREERLEGDAAAARLLRHRLAAEPLAALMREVAGAALVLDDAAELAGGRRAVEAENLDGLARGGLLDPLAAIVVERANAAPGIARDDRVADLERAAVDQHRRDGAAADVQARLDDRAGRLGGRVGAQVELGVGDEQDALEQIVEAFGLLRRDTRDLDVPAPLLRLQPFGRELAQHTVGVRVGKIDLVDGDDDRHLSGAGVVDRLLGLRHHAVVGGDDEDGDVGHLGAAGAHRREGLVAGRVEEGDAPAVVVGLVGADVLRDPAGFRRHDRRLANRVEQRRLAVVDVAHDRDDRRPCAEQVVCVLVGLGLDVVVVGVLDRHLTPELGCDQLHLVVGQRLGGGLHRAEVHQQLDDLRHRDPERLREVAQRDAGFDGRRAGRRDDLARLARAAVGVAIAGALALALSGAAAALVDDDAAPALGPAAARPDRSIRLAVCHQLSSVETSGFPGRRGGSA